MISQLGTVVASVSFALCCHAADASDIACTHPDDPNHSFTIEGERGVYTWDDHGIERARELRCYTQSDGSTACHQWGQDRETGRSVIIYQMFPDGMLVEAGAWVMMNVSRVIATPGFVCTR